MLGLLHTGMVNGSPQKIQALDLNRDASKILAYGLQYIHSLLCSFLI